MITLPEADISSILVPDTDILLYADVHLLLKYGGLTFVKLSQFTLQYL